MEEIAAYIRLSKEDENKGESESITNQKELIKEYVEKTKIGKCKYFIDDGYSGGNFERPRFKEMIKEIEKGKIKTVITKDTSRLGRDFIETSQYMFKYFPEHNVRYIALLENFDTANPNGVEDMIPFQTIINDWYLKDISKKIKSVRQNKMRQGLYMGSTVAYGYKRNNDNNCKLEIDEYASQIVKRIFKLRLDGLSPTMIARKLSEEKIEPPSIYSGKNIRKTYTTYLWGVSTIRHILGNEIYIGNLVQRKFDKINYKSKKKIKLSKEKWIIEENCVKPIISKEEFEKVQQMQKMNIGVGNKKYNYLLKGLVVCGDCGSTMTVRKRKIKTKSKGDRVENYYCCTNNIRYRNGVCSLHYYNEQKLNEIIIECLKEYLKKYADKNKMRDIIKNIKVEDREDCLEKEIQVYERKVDKLKVALKKLYIDKANNLITDKEFIELKEVLEDDRKIYMAKVMESNEKKHKNELKEKSNDIDKIIGDFLELKNTSKQILIGLIRKIEIMQNKQIKIFFNFNGSCEK